MHKQVLRELANVIARPHSVILERSGQSGGSLEEIWKEADVIPTWKEEDPGSYRPVSLILFLGKVME